MPEYFLFFAEYTFFYHLYPYIKYLMFCRQSFTIKLYFVLFDMSKVRAGSSVIQHFALFIVFFKSKVDTGFSYFVWCFISYETPQMLSIFSYQTQTLYSYNVFSRYF